MTRCAASLTVHGGEDVKEQAIAILKTAARYVLVFAAEALILIARGATWLADQARGLSRGLE